MDLVSLIEPTSVDETLLDTKWILAMQEELNQFSRIDVCTLVPRPKGNHVIGTKWLFKNKLNEKGEMILENPTQQLLRGYSGVTLVAYTFDELPDNAPDVYSHKRKRKPKSTGDGPSGTATP
ncbi:hypothetical protein KIW84_062170 [Lathyrus oleraceus]|uniref:Reverse transcriptase Ty1/copia-type domain-containing protein n=1 Tax=Pisum sativum TaxID=3888 RepID=A0A9D4W6K5_PEA|nr:hypothetical protein KIW84_062170 [Pisum sativum]